jgi:uncharacterized protein (TIGR00269 family)
MVDKDDKIGVALSGGKDSLSLLHILSKILKKQRGIELIAVLIDEGIKGYRDVTRKLAEEYCKKIGVELYVYSFKDEFGYSLDEIVKKLDINPCSVCGVFRRYLLNKYARKLGITKLATGHNIDDETQSILMNQFRNNLEMSARLGPVTGIKRDKKFIPRIKPFYFLTEKEVMTYAFLNNLTEIFNECPYGASSYRNRLRDFLNEFERDHPAIKFSIVKSFLEILPCLKEKYKNKKIKRCKECGEPCSQDICKACEYKKMLENV